METKCDFCKLLEKPMSNPGWIATFSNSVAFLNHDQFYRGRIVVIFKHHIEDLLELTIDESIGFYSEMLKVAKTLKISIQPERINYAILGNRIAHLHWHLIPRLSGDHLEGKAPWPHPTHLLSEQKYESLAEHMKNYLKTIEE